MKRKNSPLLSIIIPVYNTEKFLERCLNSVVQQTYKNIEIIVVNDGSPDNSDEIVKRYMETDERIKYIDNAENSGLYQARLCGYENATGEYIASLDSDDFVGKDYYRQQMEIICAKNADVVISNMTTYYQNSGERYHRTYGNYAISELELSGKEIVEKYFEMDAEISQWWFVWNKVYKKTLWDKCYTILSAYQGHHIMLEDFVYGTVFMTNADYIITNANDNYYYVRHDSASTGSGGGAEKIEKNVNDIVDAFNFLTQYFGEAGIGEEGIQFLNKACQRWKKTWTNSVNKARIDDSSKVKIVGKLNEIPVNVEKTAFDDKWSGYFYRELTRYNCELDEIKEQIILDETKVVCIEITDTLIGYMFHPDTFFNVLIWEWETENKENIRKIIQARKKCEQRYFNNVYDNKSNHRYPSIDDIYESVKLSGITKDNVLLDKVKECEKRVRKKYSFIRKEILELLDYCRWIKKTVVLLNGSVYEPDIPFAEGEDGIKKYNLYECKENVFEIICRESNCLPQNILFLGGDDFYTTLNKQTKRVKIDKVNSLAKQNYDWTPEQVERYSPVIEHKQGEEINGILEVSNILQFSNPFLPIAEKSIFNTSPFVLGTAAIGTHIMSVLGWLTNILRIYDTRHICFLGEDTFLYYKCFQYIQKENGYLQRISSSYQEYSTEELVLSWILWPLNFDEKYAKALNMKVSDILIYLRKMQFDTTELEDTLFRNGIGENSKINTYNDCILMNMYFEKAFSDLEGLKKTYMEKIVLPSQSVVFGADFRETDLFLLQYFQNQKIIFAELFENNNIKETCVHIYYKKEKLIDYPIRTYLYSQLFRKKEYKRYGERFVIHNIERGIQRYLDTYMWYFGDIIEKLLPYYGAADSEPFERFVNFPENNDRLLFDIVDWRDYERKSAPIRLLSNVWWDKLKDNNLLDQPKKEEPVSQKVITKVVTKTEKQKLNLYSNYYKTVEYPLDKINKFERFMLYWIFDKDMINYQVRKYAVSRVLLLPLLKLCGKKVKPQKECLYIATSNYNLLCCLVHKAIYNADKDCDLILSIWRKDKVDELTKRKLFKNIYLMDDNHFRNMTWALDKEMEGADSKKIDYLVEGFYDKLYVETPVRILDYKHIVATNTIMPITVLLQKLHIPYDCMEEAAGLYSNNDLLMNNMKNFHPKSEVYALKKYKMFNMDYVKGKRFVNIDAQEGDYSKERVVDFNVISNLKQMDFATRKEILGVFSAHETMKGEEKETCLVLTYPLASRSGLTESEHIETYRLIMDIFCKDKMIHFKPHPDDKVDYKKYYGNEIDFRLINKQILSELLEFETKTTYEKAITTVSTSTNNLQNSKEKIVFGKEFEKEYKNLALYFAYCQFIRRICDVDKYKVIAVNMYTEMFQNIFRYGGDKVKDTEIKDCMKEKASGIPSIIICNNVTSCDLKALDKDDIVIIDNNYMDCHDNIPNHAIYNLVVRIENSRKKQQYAFTAILPIEIKAIKGQLETLNRSGYIITIE